MGYWGHVDGFSFDATTLLPLGLYLEVDTTGRDPSKWKEMGVYYNGVYYPSKQEFRDAWSSSSFEKVAVQNTYNATLGGTDRTGESFAHDAKAKPVVVAPEGNRFSVDTEKQYFEWGAFGAYLAFNRDTGLRLYDITYNGERIMYELGLDEAIAHCELSARPTLPRSLSDHDLGRHRQTLARTRCSRALHISTPGTPLAPTRSSWSRATTVQLALPSSTLPSTSMSFPGPTRALSASLRCQWTIPFSVILPVTMFPSRATSHCSSRASLLSVSTRQVTFLSMPRTDVVLSGNYDYTFSYIFYMDGSVETRVQASGYIQSAFYAHNDEFGYNIGPGLSGSMHDHVLTFKADIDILGTNNSFARHAVVPVNQTYPWSRGISRPGMKMQRSYVETEDDGAMDYKKGEMLMVVNQDALNAYGEPRGYRVMPSVGSGHTLTIQE
jgi:primary-amine oxidase